MADSSLEQSFTLPPTYYGQNYEGTTTGMMMAGMIMVTRNRFLAWPALLMSINSFLNQHPMRAKDGTTNALSNLVMVFIALLTSYLPLLTVNKNA